MADIKSRLDKTNGKPYKEYAEILIKSGYANKYDENGNSVWGYSYRMWRETGSGIIVNPFGDDKKAYEQRMFLLEYFKVSLNISSEDGRWFAQSNKVKADAGWYDTREEAENECLAECVKKKEDRKDKCIHPNCECLDYCEALDPYSKTPIEKATPKNGL